VPGERKKRAAHEAALKDNVMKKNRFISLLLVLVAGSAMAQKAQPPKSLRLYVFDCGTLDIPDTSPYRFKKEELTSAVMSAPCFLVAHPKGTLMWDTGPVPDANFKPGGGPGTMRYATSTRPLTARLAEVGYAPSDIQYLALSHFHWDHVGNANLFAGATWLVPKAERDIMFADPPSPRTEPQNFSPVRHQVIGVHAADPVGKVPRRCARGVSGREGSIGDGESAAKGGPKTRPRGRSRLFRENRSSCPVRRSSHRCLPG
jgi:hypothetical protein